MSICKSHHNEGIVLETSADVDADSDRSEIVAAVNELSDAVAELAAENEALREENAELREETEALREETKSLRSRVESVSNSQESMVDHVYENRERLDDHEEQLEDSKEHRAELARRGAETRQTVTKLKDEVEGDTEVDATGPAQTQSVPAETALEDIVSVPDHLAEEGLTANQFRARFVAAGVRGYTTSVPKGHAMRSSDIKRVLRAGTDCKGHSQTVDRVIDLLDSLGEDEVEVVDRRGERRVVFSEETAARLDRLANTADTNHDVVTGVKG